jgi:flagellar basal body-associated protein FliL
MRLSPTLAALLAAALLASGPGAPARAAEEGGAAVHKPTHAESYVMVEPIYASILEGVRPRGLLLVEFGLDVPDDKFREQVNRSVPRLRDAYVRSLLVYAATAVRPWRQPSVEDISARMQAITNQVMGRQGARVLMAQTAIRLTH